MAFLHEIYKINSQCGGVLCPSVSFPDVDCPKLIFGFLLNLLLMLCAKVRAAASNRVCTGENGTFAQRVRSKILSHSFILKVFGEPLLLQCWKNMGLSCHTECSSVAPFVWL